MLTLLVFQFWIHWYHRNVVHAVVVVVHGQELLSAGERWYSGPKRSQEEKGDDGEQATGRGLSTDCATYNGQ